MAPLPGWLAIANVTALVAVVTTLPPLSSTATTGWVAVGPLVPLPGWAVKLSWVGVPTVMAKVADVAPVSPVDVALKV